MWLPYLLCEYIFQSYLKTWSLCCHQDGVFLADYCWTSISIINHNNYIRSIWNTGLSSLGFIKVVNHCFIRQSLLHIIIAKLYYHIPICKYFPSNSIAIHNFTFSILICFWNPSILVHLFTHHLHILLFLLLVFLVKLVFIILETIITVIFIHLF